MKNSTQTCLTTGTVFFGLKTSSLLLQTYLLLLWWNSSNVILSDHKIFLQKKFCDAGVPVHGRLEPCGDFWTFLEHTNPFPVIQVTSSKCWQNYETSEWLVFTQVLYSQRYHNYYSNFLEKTVPRLLLRLHLTDAVTGYNAMSQLFCYIIRSLKLANTIKSRTLHMLAEMASIEWLVLIWRWAVFFMTPKVIWCRRSWIQAGNASPKCLKQKKGRVYGQLEGLIVSL